MQRANSPPPKPVSRTRREFPGPHHRLCLLHKHLSVFLSSTPGSFPHTLPLSSLLSPSTLSSSLLYCLPFLLLLSLNSPPSLPVSLIRPLPHIPPLPPCIPSSSSSLLYHLSPSCISSSPSSPSLLHYLPLPVSPLPPPPSSSSCLSSPSPRAKCG